MTTAMVTSEHGPTEPNEPAPALSALELLGSEARQQAIAEKQGPWHSDLESLNNKLPKDLWTSGKVIGLASTAGNASLSAHLIASHLLRVHGDAIPPAPLNPSTSAFIISPPNPSILDSIYNILLRNRTSRDGPSDDDFCLHLLKTVDVLSYLDFTGLAEVLGEVSSRLHHTASTAQSGALPPRIVLLITSLSETLLSTSRRSGQTSVSAILANLLHSITHLSRSYPSLLVLLDLDLEIVRGDAYDESSVLPSAFSNSSGTSLKFCPGGSVGRTLEAGMDCVVTMWQTERRQTVVEVVKDRTGSTLGAWSVWKR